VRQSPKLPRYRSSNGRGWVSRGVAALTLVGVLGLSACGGDDDDSSATAAAGSDSVAPEDIKVEPAVVTAGLTKMPATIAAAIAAIGTPDAEAKLDQIEAEWASFEGTVRDTDPTLYLAIEDELTPLQRQIADGDTEAATTTATTMSDLFSQYLAKYPG
jgi:iron uptake system EfeUOB component EfeO/EfeM